MKKPNFFLIALVALLVVIEVLFLKPSTVEINETETQQGMFKDVASMVKAQKPNDEVQYTIQGFHYAAVEGEVKQWEMEADTALLYEVSKHVVASNARIKMFDVGGKITYIRSKEARYFMGSRDFDLYKDVEVTFPDGFWVKTDRAHYANQTRMISSQENFYGESMQKDSTGKKNTEYLQIWGRGFTGHRSEPLIQIHADVRARIHRLLSNEIMEVHSDTARVDRFAKIVAYHMNSLKDYVNSDLGSLHVRSKRQEVTYNNDSHEVKYMVAYDDVFIKETDPQREQHGLKYATCQQADFYTKENKIIMTGFPSAYQEADTVTGEVITIFRTQNLIEVTQANGYHEGLDSKEKSKQ